MIALYPEVFSCREMASWVPALRPLLEERLRRMTERDRKGRDYAGRFAHFPEVVASTIELDRDRIRIGRPTDLSTGARSAVDTCLRALIPWRKGPFEIFGIRIDCEWASYMKWNRVAPHMTALSGRRVLDIGSSSGYYMFRMQAAAPKLVVGLEPYLTFYCQFRLLQHLIGAPGLHALPLRLEALPIMEAFFDSVFCMGILYHQRDPQAALSRIARMMRAGGELILETLIITGDKDDLLRPPGRYAKMNNVYALPTVRRMEFWLRRSGFGRIRCVDVAKTTPAEQHRTEWMPFESLTDFLQRDDPRQTVEGHPAPVRAVLLAERRCRQSEVRINAFRLGAQTVLPPEGPAGVRPPVHQARAVTGPEHPGLRPLRGRLGAAIG